MTPETAETSEKISDPRMPVAVLTGFLGAGKTTVLNAVLSFSGAGQIAVVVNEFGEVGLDHDLIESVEDEIVLMQSGCLCCSIRGDLSETLVNLIQRRGTGGLSFERIVIETTGLADPGPILQTLLVDPDLARTTRLDGLITVVDAVNGPATLDAQFEAVSQVAMADLLLLSKTDLVSAEVADNLARRLRGLNPTAEIKRPAHGQIDVDGLWRTSGLRADVSKKDVIAWTSPAGATQADPLDNLSGLAWPKKAHSPVARVHDSRISSVSIILDAPLKDAAFDLWLDTLIALKGPDILRVKGIVFLEGTEMPFVFHGVQQIFDPPVPVINWTGDDRRSRIVIIARDLDRPGFKRSLEMLRAHQPDAIQGDQVLMTHE